MIPDFAIYECELWLGKCLLSAFIFLIQEWID